MRRDRSHRAAFADIDSSRPINDHYGHQAARGAEGVAYVLARLGGVMANGARLAEKS